MAEMINPSQEHDGESRDSDNQLLCDLAQADLNKDSEKNGDESSLLRARAADGQLTSASSAATGNTMAVNSASRRTKNEEKKIFVGGISWDTSDEDLKKFFTQFGEVAHVQIKFDHFTGRSRGFGFVEFAAPDGCQKALASKEYELKNKKIEIKPAKSRENKKVFVGGLPADYTEDELRKHFSQYGQIEEIEWPFDKFNNRRKNFAFIVFDDEEATQNAALNSKQKFGDRVCDVKIAVPQYMRPHRQFNMGGPAAMAAAAAAAAYGTGWGDFGGSPTSPYATAHYGAPSGGAGPYGYSQATGAYGSPPTSTVGATSSAAGYYDDYYANYAAAAAAAYDPQHGASAGAGAPANANPYDYSSAASGWPTGSTGTSGYEGWGYSSMASGTGSAPSGAGNSRGPRGGYSGYGGGY